MKGLALFYKERFEFAGIKEKPPKKNKKCHTNCLVRKVETNVEAYSSVVDSSLFKSWSPDTGITVYQICDLRGWGKVGPQWVG